MKEVKEVEEGSQASKEGRKEGKTEANKRRRKPSKEKRKPSKEVRKEGRKPISFYSIQFNSIQFNSTQLNIIHSIQYYMNKVISIAYLSILIPTYLGTSNRAI